MNKNMTWTAELIDTMSSDELAWQLARLGACYETREQYWALVHAARLAGLGLPSDLAGHQPALPVRTDDWDERVHYARWLRDREVED